MQVVSKQDPTCGGTSMSLGRHTFGDLPKTGPHLQVEVCLLGEGGDSHGTLPHGTEGFPELGPHLWEDICITWGKWGHSWGPCPHLLPNEGLQHLPVPSSSGHPPDTEVMAAPAAKTLILKN